MSFKVAESEKNMDKYIDEVMEAVRQRMGLEEDDESADEEIMQMDRSQVFKEYCLWHGLLGNWCDTLLEVVENIYDVELKERD